VPAGRVPDGCGFRRQSEDPLPAPLPHRQPHPQRRSARQPAASRDREDLTVRRDSRLHDLENRFSVRAGEGPGPAGQGRLPYQGPPRQPPQSCSLPAKNHHTATPTGPGPRTYSPARPNRTDVTSVRSDLTRDSALPRSARPGERDLPRHALPSPGGSRWRVPRPGTQEPESTTISPGSSSRETEGLRGAIAARGASVTRSQPVDSASGLALWNVGPDRTQGRVVSASEGSSSRRSKGVDVESGFAAAKAVTCVTTSSSAPLQPTVNSCPTDECDIMPNRMSRMSHPSNT
jgi:hypothetical protein